MTAARPRRCRRPGYTLLELLAVIAILVTLGGLLAPTFQSLAGDSKVKAGADLLRGRIADAKAAAMKDGRAYRVAISEDGTRVRVSPDEVAFLLDPPTADEQDDFGPLVVEDDLPTTVTVVPQLPEGAEAVVDQGGWLRVLTCLPDGTCREDVAILEVREPGTHSMIVRVRGLTGASSVSVAPAATPATPQGITP
jgi:prepilin-type N-terminal cleavage/methylation domain-containing protein